VNEVLAQIARIVAAECGIRLSGRQHAALRAAIARVGAGEPAELLRALRSSTSGPRLLTRLVEEVAVHETFFLRESAALESIPWGRLFAQAAARGESVVRVWSAACSTGEEAYTLALLAAEAFAPAPPPVRVLATDLSEAALRSAAAGRYGPRALRGVGQERLDRWFVADGRSHAVGAELRRLVEFRRHNLLQDSLPPLGESPFDLVLCRNVLMYFASDDVERASIALHGSVRRDGVLMLGSADTLAVTTARMAREATAVVQPVLLPARRLRRPLLPETVDEPVEPQVEAHVLFLRGLTQLEAGDVVEAAETLRGALYLRPTFALAAFQLGRAHDAAGDDGAASRAYRQTLRTLDTDHAHDVLLEQVNLGDIAEACRARLAVLDGRTPR
jgi:chemotaxis methyl-accepting protein methylase